MGVTDAQVRHGVPKASLVQETKERTRTSQPGGRGWAGYGCGTQVDRKKPVQSMLLSLLICFISSPHVFLRRGEWQGQHELPHACPTNILVATTSIRHEWYEVPR